MGEFEGRNVILGVTGSIAAYKSPEIVRQVIKGGGSVKVVMTKASRHFIGALTFDTLTGNQTYCDYFEDRQAWEIEHISLADWGDLLVIAPATANIIAKAATGIADDVLSTLIVTFDKAILIAPAMNDRMLNNPVTQENIERLKKRGVNFVEPEEGYLACGTSGRGRLADIPHIIEGIGRLLSKKKDYEGKRILITAGRTEERLDPVRLLTNRSTGRMGIEMARRARNRGARVTLILGPTDLQPPQGVQTIRITSAQDMQKEVSKNFHDNDILIMAAAVADYTPVITYEHKIKKSEGGLSLELKRTADILKTISPDKGNRILVGFALETENDIENARMKLTEKNLDLIVVNNPLIEGAAFAVETNTGFILDRNNNKQEFPIISKGDLADLILDKLNA
ncbi:bifunctional phosphopantothenoylcysteine decarboxylase/phosphopantothenate--cysteine ligase CoaBC [bacterium]|nr:bifunctional phosphopantothenoylcysteine decarboxylase/phosphopantothenate--cysteine ligase CoaBC [bacterium]